MYRMYVGLPPMIQYASDLHSQSGYPAKARIGHLSTDAFLIWAFSQCGLGTMPHIFCFVFFLPSATKTFNT